MSVVEEPTTIGEEPDTGAVGGPDLSKLEDHTPQYLRTSRSVAGLVFTVGIVYLMFCLRPIWHTDVWGHVAYGRWIWEAKSLPTSEPLLPLAAGMPFVDTAWLSQLIGYATVQSLGNAGLQGLYALTITLCTACLAIRCYRNMQSGWFSFAGIVGFLMLAWEPLTVMRPQAAGLACFVILLTRLTARRLHSSDWLLMPVLFTAWANLHGSFVVGLMLLGCFAAGRAIDLFRRTGSIRAALADDRVRRTVLLLELSAVAVLLNPYGLQIYPAALQFSSNANLQDLTEWHPLSLRDHQGTVFGIAAVMLAMLYRSSPRRVAAWEVLALVLFGWSALWSNRMIVWWAPVAAYLLAIHGHAVWRAWRRLPLIPEPPVGAGKWSVVTAGLIWICFAYSPLGMRILHGKQPKPSQAFSATTPRAAVEFLLKNPPQGQIFNTYEWGDFLLWAGPPGMKVFVNSHAHLIPREVWSAYMQISDVQGGWEETLDRYSINTIVVDKEFRESLIKKLKENDRWKLVFSQDGQSVFVRKIPI